MDQKFTPAFFNSLCARPLGFTFPRATGLFVLRRIQAIGGFESPRLRCPASSPSDAALRFLRYRRRDVPVCFEPAREFRQNSR